MPWYKSYHVRRIVKLSKKFGSEWWSIIPIMYIIVLGKPIMVKVNVNCFVYYLAIFVLFCKFSRRKKCSLSIPLSSLRSMAPKLTCKNKTDLSIGHNQERIIGVKKYLHRIVVINYVYLASDSIFWFDGISLECRNRQAWLTNDLCYWMSMLYWYDPYSRYRDWYSAFWY